VFTAEARDAGGRVMVVLIPDSVQLNEPDMQIVNHFVEGVCREAGIPFLDVTPVLESEEDHPSLYLFPVDAHNSPKGLRLIAQSISDYIVEMKLLSS
jgi:hypothetical protein